MSSGIGIELVAFMKVSINYMAIFPLCKPPGATAHTGGRLNRRRVAAGFGKVSMTHDGKMDRGPRIQRTGTAFTEN